MTDTITLTGLVGTEPRSIVTSEGLAITNFRLASTQRRYDKSEGKWVDGETNWYTITCFRQLAINASGSVKKGERVIVTGRLRLRSWNTGEKAGMNVDIEAEALGHDLLFGTTTFSRSMSAPQSSPDAPNGEVESSGAGDSGWAAESPGPRESATGGEAGQGDTFVPVAAGSAEPEPAF